MSKRRATGQITPGSSAKRPYDASSENDGRAQLFSARLKSLNQQFAEWVKNQAASHTDELWLDGVQSYQEHVAKMLQDFKDIVGEQVVDAHNNKQRDTFTPTPGSLFKTPVSTAAGRDASAAPGTGGSTGRRSVTFADTASAHTPAPGLAAAAAAANGTPAHANTVNAGHTPAPAGFGRYDAGTPSGDDMPTPQFKLPPASNAGTPAATPASQSGNNLFGTPAVAAGDDKGADTAAKTPSSSGGFALGVAGSGFGTPVATAAADSAAKDGDAAAYTFGTPASKATADTPAGTPASQTSPGWGAGFTFGTPAAGLAAPGSETATPGSSTPTFGGFGAGSSGKDSTDKAAAAPTFSFGVPHSSGTPAAASSTPAPTPGAAGSGAAAGDGSGPAASTGKPAAFSFGTTSSTAAAGGTGSSTAPAAGSSPAFTLGVPSSGAAGPSSSSSPVVTFGVGSSANAGNNSSGGAAAAGSTPPAFSFGAGSSSGGAGASGSSPPLSAFGAPAAAASAGPSPAFGTPVTGGFGGAANGTSGSFFQFPAPSDAAGGSNDGGGAGAGAEEEAEPQEAAVPVARDERYTTLWSKGAVLLISNKNKDTGAWEWTNRGRGECSVRHDTQEPDKHYIFFNLPGQGKQLIMHLIRATTKPEPMPNAPNKVAATLNTVVNTTKPAAEGQRNPTPVTNWELKSTVLRFAGADTVQEFIAEVNKCKPAA